MDLLFELDAGVATLVLNRPAASNALSPSMREALTEAVVRIEADRSIRAVVLTGAGGSFSAGGDVKELARPESAEPEARLVRMRAYHRLIQSLAQLDRPVIAAVNGAAYGAGFGLALLADFIVASERARFCMAFQRVGLVPDFGATYTLPRAVGLPRARELFYTAREIDASEAQRLGLVLEVVAASRLAERSLELAQALARASQAGLSMTKRALGASLTSDLATMLEMESTAQAVAVSTASAREALTAVAARQAPPFSWPAAPAREPQEPSS